MGIYRVKLVLSGSYGGGRIVSEENFLPFTSFQFMGKPVNVVAHAGGASAYIDFASLSIEQFIKEEEPSELFHQNLDYIQQSLTYWLDQQPLSIFEAMSERGLKMRLFFNVDIDDNQIGLPLAPSLLKACGRLNITIDINSY